MRVKTSALKPKPASVPTLHAQSDSKSDSPPHRKPPPKHPNTKRIGELAEAAFVVKAAGLGFAVSKPWGDSERYDFILDSGNRTWRVQIKCTQLLNHFGASCSERERRGLRYEPAPYKLPPGRRF